MSRSRDAKISIVIPSFNEEGNLAIIANQLQAVLESYGPHEIIFVDDGSSDGSLNILKGLNLRDSRLKFISFSRNFGHQAALRAGLDYSSGDAVISMDADLQHPTRLIPEMLKHWDEGVEIVYTRREDDTRQSLFKRLSARIFYRTMSILSDLQVEPGAADFRLIDKKVVDVIRGLPEVDLFLRGMIFSLGFKKVGIDYLPDLRQWGTSKYNLRKMLNLAMSGVTSFSVRPLHLSTYLGLTVFVCSSLYAFYAIYITLFTSRSVSGWASVLVSVLLLGGVQLIMLGIMGEYIGKLFLQAKGRPSYIIAEMVSSLSNRNHVKSE